MNYEAKFEFTLTLQDAEDLLRYLRNRLSNFELKRMDCIASNNIDTEQYYAQLHKKWAELVQKVQAGCIAQEQQH
jgi:hypothetical protein